MKILIVDDNEAQALTLSWILQEWGHDAHACVVSSDAVSTYLDFQPNIALLDIAMPGLSGLDICKQLRALACDRHPKIIAQTGYGDVASVRKIEQAGFDEILLKPVDPEKLRLAINRFAMPEI